MGLVTALVGCGGSGTHDAHADAGSVALRYSQALFAGRFSHASHYVAPSSQHAILALTAGLRHASVSSHNLAIGSTHVNSDAHTDNPIFRVKLARQAGGRWLVSFSRTPSASAPSAPTQP